MPITLDWVRVEHFMRLRGIDDANELAELAETHRSSMFRVSKGESLPHMATLAKMCFYLGCQPGDLLSYEHSELDLSQPHRLFDLFPINEKVWTKFRNLDKLWRRSIGRWELESGDDMVDFYLNGALGAKWKGGQAIAKQVDGEWVAVEPIDLLRTRLSYDHDDGSGSQDKLRSAYNRAQIFATSEIVGAIAESFLKYRWSDESYLKLGHTPIGDFERVDQLENVYEHDPGVLEARRVYKDYCNSLAIGRRTMMNKADLTTARFGCEIERDWHMLGHYASAMSVDDMIDYVEHHAMPISNMDKEIRRFDRAINTHAQRAEEHHRVLDEAIAEDVARGMDDKED